MRENIQLSVIEINVGNSICKWIMKHKIIYSQNAKTNIINSFLYGETFNLTDLCKKKCPDKVIEK